MSLKRIITAESSPLVKVAALVIIFAGVIYAKSIIIPFLLALFISNICEQPISWLEKKRIPRWLAFLVVILGMIFLFSGFAFLIGETISSFSGNLSKYESTLTNISNSFIQYLNEKGLKIRQDQIFNLVQPAKILEFTASALNKLVNMMGNTFLIFLIILFTLMEFGSFSVKAKGDLDFRGILGITKEVPVGFKAIRLSFILDCDATEEQIQSITKLTERYCVVYQTIVSATEVKTRIEKRKDTILF